MSNHNRGLELIIGAAFILTGSFCSAQTPPSASPVPTIVPDTAQGWIWNHMSSCDTSNTAVASAHAGGDGSSATYIISGTGVEIFSIPSLTVNVGASIHNTGKLRVFIDGTLIGDFAEYISGQSATLPICMVHDLKDCNHALLLQPVGGWAAVASIIIEHVPVASTGASLNPSRGIPAGVYRVSPRVGPDQGLDIFQNKTDNGSELQLYGYHGASNEQFKIEKLSKDTYILHPLSALADALSLLPDNTRNVQFLGIWPFIHNPAQTWVITASIPGYFRISPSTAPTLALTVGGDDAQGNGLTFVPYSGANEQDWTFTLIVPGS